MAHDGEQRSRDDAVEPFFAGLRGAHDSGADPDAGAPADDGPPPDPWRRGAHAHVAPPAAGAPAGPDEDRATAGMVAKALLLMIALVVASAAIYFVFGA
jgi:hypothetical protein